MESSERKVSKRVARRMGIKVGLDMKNRFLKYSKKIIEAIDEGYMEAVISTVAIAELCGFS